MHDHCYNGGMAETQGAQVLTDIREYDPVRNGGVYEKKKSSVPQWIRQRLPQRHEVQAVYAEWEPHGGPPRYQDLVEIGHGGYGQVYRAVDTKIGRLVALKIARAARQDDPTYLTPTQDHVNTVAEIEAKVTAGFYRNPHVVGVLDHFIREPEAEGEQRLAVTVMEYMDELLSPTLDKLIGGGPLPVNQIIGIAEGLCDAIESLEADGVEHRDIKPENIFYDGATVVLGDLGSSNKVVGDASHSPPFNPPEYFDKNSAFRKIKRDHYAYSMMLYMITTGEYPFTNSGNTPIHELVESILHEQPKKIAGNEWLSTIYPGEVGKDLDAFFAKALAKKPRDRFRNPAETRDAFVQIMRRQHTA